MYNHITEQEYLDWFKDAKVIIQEGPTFTSCCGPHEFSTIISKNGMIYDMGWGWYPEEDKTPNAQYPYKTTYWYGVKKMHMDGGQSGEGI